MSQPPSIIKKIKLIIWLLGIASLAILFLVTSYFAIHILKRQTSLEMERLFNSCTNLIENYLYRDDLLIKYLLKVAPAGELEVLKEYLKKQLPKITSNKKYALLSKENRIILVGDKRFRDYLDLDLSGFEYIKRHKRISRVHQSIFVKSPVVTFLYEVPGGYSLIFERDLEPLRHLLSKVTSPSIKGSMVFILSNHGTVVYHPQKELVERRENLRSTFESINGPDQYGLYMLKMAGDRYWCFRRLLDVPKGWEFYAITPWKNALIYIWKNLWPVLGVIFAIFVFTLFIADKIFDKLITRPIDRLSEVLSSLDLNGIHKSSLLNIKELSDSLEMRNISTSIDRMLNAIYKSQEDLLKKEEILRTVIEYATDWAYWIDENGQFKYNSHRCYEITGYTQEEFKKKPALLLDIVHPDDKELFKKHLDNMKIQRTHEPHENMEFRIVRKDGEVRWVSHSCSKVYDGDGNFLGVRGSNLDVTDQKLATLELSKVEKLKSLGVLAGGIAHDFNNLLTAILGNISLSKLKAQDDLDLFKRLDAAEKAAYRAQALTQQLLTFAKGGAPIKKVISLKKIILETAEFSLKGSNVACKFDFAKDLWSVKVDPGQISQVIQNMVINADQAMPDGGIITIKAYNLPLEQGVHQFLPEGNYVVITIEDKGSGISPEDLPRIFDPFFTTKKMGSGLGLAVCFSIVRKHGGFIDVESKKNYGTKFTIYLPALGEDIEKTETKEAKISSSTKGKRVLVMDDEENIRELLRESLIYLGYEADVAKDGKEALKKYKDAREKGKPFDAVIMDITVPGGMGGKEAVKFILKEDPNAKVIVSTGYSKDEVIKNFQEFGFCAALPKPYKLEELSSILISVFSNQN